MEIDINQKKISIGDKYQIFIDGQQTHTAAAKLFRWLAEISLFDLNGDRAKYIIKKSGLSLTPPLICQDGIIMCSNSEQRSFGNSIIIVRLGRTCMKFLDTGAGNFRCIKMISKLPGGIKKRLHGLMAIIIKS